MMLPVLAEVLQRHGAEGWLVGGTVRDRQLGRLSPDLDIVVDADPAGVAKAVAGALSAPWFPLSARHGAYRVMGAEGHVDVARLRGATIQEDLGLRDFTINAMASPIGSPETVIDPFGGRTDLDARLLTAVSDQIFNDDPLRLMRAARFTHVMDLRLDGGLRDLIRAQAADLAKSAWERITAELALILDAGRSEAALMLLDDLGLFEVVFPGVGAPEVCLAMARLDAEIAWLPGSSEDWGPSLSARFGVPVDGVFSRAAALRLAAVTRGLEKERAAALGRRLKLSGPVISLLCSVSGWLRRDPEAVIPQRLLEAVSSERSTVLFLWEAAPWEPEVALIAGAQAQSATDRLGAAEAVPAEVAVLLRKWWLREASLEKPPFDGDLLMRELGLTEGKELGAVLREARLAWEAGEAGELESILVVARGALEAVRAEGMWRGIISCSSE